MDVFKGYANAAGATFWLHDVVLDFGLKEPETQGDEMQPDELVCRLHMLALTHKTFWRAEISAGRGEMWMDSPLTERMHSGGAVAATTRQGWRDGMKQTS